MPRKFPVTNCPYCNGLYAHATNKGLWICRKRLVSLENDLFTMLQRQQLNASFFYVGNSKNSIFTTLNKIYLDCELKMQNPYHIYISFIKRVLVIQNQQLLINSSSIKQPSTSKIEKIIKKFLQNLSYCQKQQWLMLYSLFVKLLQAKCQCNINKRVKIQQLAQTYLNLKLKLIFESNPLIQMIDFTKFSFQLLILGKISEQYRSFLLQLGEQCQFPYSLMQIINKVIGNQTKTQIKNIQKKQTITNINKRQCTQQNLTLQKHHLIKKSREIKRTVYQRRNKIIMVKQPQILYFLETPQAN